jgi:hypothetical protein
MLVTCLHTSMCVFRNHCAATLRQRANILPRRHVLRFVVFLADSLRLCITSAPRNATRGCPEESPAARHTELLVESHSINGSATFDSLARDGAVSNELIKNCAAMAPMNAVAEPHHIISRSPMPTLSRATYRSAPCC